MICITIRVNVNKIFFILIGFLKFESDIYDFLYLMCRVW